MMSDQEQAVAAAHRRAEVDAIRTAQSSEPVNVSRTLPDDLAAATARGGEPVDRSVWIDVPALDLQSISKTLRRSPYRP